MQAEAATLSLAPSPSHKTSNLPDLTTVGLESLQLNWRSPHAIASPPVLIKKTSMFECPIFGPSSSHYCPRKYLPGQISPGPWPSQDAKNCKVRLRAKHCQDVGIRLWCQWRPGTSATADLEAAATSSLLILCWLPMLGIFRRIAGDRSAQNLKIIARKL